VIRISTIAAVFFFFCKLALFAQAESSGLFFSSHEVVQDERTSLCLTPGKPFRFPNGFSIEFDVNFRRDDGYYGYIFRIIANGDTNIDLVSNAVSAESNIWLIYKDEILLSYKWADLPSIDFEQWVRVRIDFDAKNNRLMTSFNEKKQEIQSPDLSHLKDFQIYFGICKAAGFHSTDACPMSIKNVSIYKPGQKLFRQWPLGKHTGNKTYDNIQQAEAWVENPHWLIDKYIRWQKLTEVEVESLNGVTSDDAGKGIFFLDDKAAYYLRYKSLDIDTIPFMEGQPYKNETGHNLIYNKYTGELWSYDFTNPVISRFTLKTGKWSSNRPEANLSDYGHNNKFISPADSSFVAILGYGHYRYKGMVNSYDKKESAWKQIDRSDQITPRYLSSAGYLGHDKMLVFGGYGSKSGRQELSPRSYYDLYEFSLSDYSFKPLWTLPTPRSPFVPAETLVADSSTDSFYTLLFNNGYYDSYLQLARFSISQPEMKIVGDSIPFKFRDTETWSYLWLNEEKSHLMAVIAHRNTIALYTIAYPPLATEEVLQRLPANGFPLFYAIGAGATVALLLLLTLAIRTRNRRISMKANISLEPLPVMEKRRVSAIYLLGGFQAFNAKGETITSSFSPTLKQLFLFLLFHSAKERRGVTSARLDEALWHDKTGGSARNNRNVNISKLRTVLEETGSIEVVNKNSLWSLQFGDTTYCDYLEVMELISKAKTDVLPTDETYRLTGLLHTGELLPNLQAEWATFYKSDYTKEVTDTLTLLLNIPENKENINLRYHIAELLLTIDPLNEEAILTKCTALSAAGKKSQSKQTFYQFAKAYEELMGSPYLGKKEVR
jgi:DNA-binding SARP family transcriptional activator